MKKVILVWFCFLISACAANEKKLQNTVSTNQNSKTVESGKIPDKPKFNPAEAAKFLLAKPVEIKAGTQVEAEIKLEIQAPFHVNSNPPSEKSYIPLEISLNDGAGMTVGKPVYPKGELKKFTFSDDKPLSVYTGEIVVKMLLKADKTVVAGQQQLSGKLKFQPCDEEVCYRPQTAEIALPIIIN